MGTLTMRTLRASPEQSNLARPVLCHRRRHPLNSQPQDGPPDGLCGLSLVVSHNLLVAQVLHPLALLAADLGGVLPALHDGVPLCAGSKSAGNFLLDDGKKRHSTFPALENHWMACSAARFSAW